MLLVKVSNNEVEKYPYSVGLLRKENPNTSFPKKPSVSDMAAFNVHPVTEVTPTLSDDQKLVKTWTPTLADGEWVLAHQAVDLTEDEIDDAVARVAAEVRTERNQRLSATDFYALTDVTLSAAMTAYRQALRNIPEQDDFPSDISWPEKPE
jgi:hypothetical protein